MRVLKAIGRFLISVWFLVPFITFLLSICVWQFSPYIGTEAFRPFDEAFGRWIFIAVLWVIALVTLLIVWLVRRFDAKQMEEEIVKGPEPAKADAENEVVTAEIGELREKMRAAITKLKKSKGGRRSLYELPWYVMIGPPGAGKTTAIVNSGLQFPLADEFGKSAIGGVGGTRNCDWWFTDNAVLIDTAGRYTTQESDAEADNAAWLGFLGLLKKHRIRQPINGAMIAISLSDLSMQDEQTQKGHALAVRRRLKELREKLGVRFPVYVLFTKADMIAGFTEYFDNLGKEEREQVWGFTLPIEKGRADASPIAAFDTEFTGLLAQLNAQLLDRMQSETDHQRRSLIAGFPAQVASVRGVAKAFLTEVFQDNKYEERQMLRGVYFTSGTQEGTPIDRLMMGMARTFGIGRQAIGTGRGTGRSFFLTRLFTDVLFPEAGLVSADDKVERRYKWTKRGAIAATILVGIGMGALWGGSFLANSALLTSVSSQVADYQTAAANVPGNPISDSKIETTVPALNVLRAMPVNPIPASVDPSVASPFDPDWGMTYGLYQGAGLANQAGQSYRAALNTKFLPRLLLRLEDQINSNANNPTILFDALKVYMMLGLQGPMDQDQVMLWMQADWEAIFPGPEYDALRADLAFHLKALISQPMQEIPLNGHLVENAQEILADMPEARRVYNSILQSPEARTLPPFRLTDVGGPNLDKAFTRSSGKPMSEGIPGIFTYEGFHSVFADQALSVVETIKRDSWVLGAAARTDQSETAMSAIRRDVLDLYYDEFTANYEQMLGDLDVVPLSSLQQAVDVTGVLSGASSPIKNILLAVDKETRLTVDPTGVDTSQFKSDAGDILVSSEIQDMKNVRFRLLVESLMASAQSAGDPPPKPPGASVEERFAWLHALVDRTDDQPSQLENVIAQLQQVSQELNKVSFGGDTAASGGQEGAALAQLQSTTAQIQGPLARWSSQISTGGAGITAEGTRASLNARWQQDVLPFCKQATENVYPFDRGAAAEIGLADFTKLFGPQGMIDSFMSTNLKGMIDTSQKPWTWKTASGGADLGISQAVLDQLQAASEIKEAFFPTGPAPGVSFQITPMALDDKAKDVQLIIDGKTISFSRKDPQQLPTAVTWPGDVGVAQITFNPALNDAENAMTKEGPWGWFRLLDTAKVVDHNAPDRKKVMFKVGGRVGMYVLQVSTVLNPFKLPALSAFKCPQSF